MRCPTCQSTRLERVERRGFMQKYLLSLLGLYPWRCLDCKSKRLFRHRARRRSVLNPQTLSER